MFRDNAHEKSKIRATFLSSKPACCICTVDDRDKTTTLFLRKTCSSYAPVAIRPNNNNSYTRHRSRIDDLIRHTEKK